MAEDQTEVSIKNSTLNIINMRWIVIEENPRPDNYVAVVITDKVRKLSIENHAHSVYDDGEKALARARAVADQFNVRKIRIFHSESHSVPLKD